MIPESTEKTGWKFAEWYDQSINWDARLQREIPVFVDVFGAPGDGGIIDAGCGTRIQEVNRLLKDFDKSKKLMKMMLKGGKGRGMRGRSPFAGLPGM